MPKPTNRWYIGEVAKSYHKKANRALKVIGVFYEDLVVGVGTVVEYARKIELGVAGDKWYQPAQPFLKPALDENHAEIQNLFTKMMGK